MNKICHVTSVHLAHDVRIFKKECLSLVEAGYEVHLIAPDRGETEFEGVTFHGLKPPSEKRLHRMRHTVNEAYQRALEVDADAYHIHDPELLRIVGKLKRKGKKVIYDVHEDLPRQILGKYYIRPILRKLIANVVERYEDRIASKVDLIVAATPRIARRFEPLNSFVTNVNNFPVQKTFRRVEGGKRFDQVCYVGGISAIRGLERVLDALLLLPEEIKLVLAGPFSDPEYEKVLAAHKAWPRVDYLGYISHERVNQVYNESFAGLVLLLPYPNHIESQPMKMFEYMSAGLPVVASNFELWEEIILPNKCGLCADPEDPQAIASAIISLHKDRNLVEEMGRNGVRQIRTKYNWSNEAEVLVEAYKRLG